MRLAILLLALHQYSFAVQLFYDNRPAFSVSLGGGIESVEQKPEKDPLRMKQTLKVFLYGNVFGVDALYAMPESVTNWDRSDIKRIKWWKNVTTVSIWDKDDWFLNYVAHPYWGAVYYVDGRQEGYSKGESLAILLGTSAMWEYGIEAFTEKPSVQDLIVTPLFGSLIGEYFYTVIKNIQANDYTLANSKALGKMNVFALNPFHFIVNKMHAKHTTTYSPTPNDGLMLSFNL